MIHILHQPETKPYLPQPTTTAWVKTTISGAEGYRLEQIEEASAINMNAGWGNREPVQTRGLIYAKLSLLESGALLASFPLLGTIPGSIQTNPYTVWFVLDAPAIVPAGIFGREIEISAGKHLMASSLGTWVVFFRPRQDKKPLDWNLEPI